MENLRNPRVLGTQYRVYDKDGKYKRTIYKTDEKNLDESDLCSGHLDNDETETQAMVRELKEELGINLEESMNVVKVTQQGVPLGFESSKKIKNFFITFYCLKRNSSKIEIQKEEIDKYVWLPLEETFQLLKCGRTKFPKNFDYSDIFEKVRNIYYSQSKGNTQREE